VGEGFPREPPSKRRRVEGQGGLAADEVENRRELVVRLKDRGLLLVMVFEAKLLECRRRPVEEDLCRSSLRRESI